MKTLIYIIVIFFWILSMISKSKRQKQQAAERERIRNLNKSVSKNPAIGRQRAEDVKSVFTQEESERSEYETAYAPDDYEGNPEQQANSLGTESREEKEAYDKNTVIIPSLSLTNAAIKQYVVAAEILGKPKALR